MIGYRYDNDGYLIGQIEIQESPLEPGVFLMPPNTSTTAPPSPSANTIPRWNGESWALSPNYSGIRYYNKIDKSEKIFEIGEEFDNIYTDKAPPIESYKEWNESLNDWSDNIEKLNAFKIQACKNKAKGLISEFDWIVDEETSPKLLNKNEFITYRSALRSIILNPTIDPDWPTKPNEVWENK